MFVAMCTLAVSGCICSPATVQVSDTGALIAASNDAVSMLFQESPEAFRASMSPAVQSSGERGLHRASIAWWREALGHCTALDISEGFTRLEDEEGHVGIEGDLRCRGGIARGRFVFERVEGRLLLWNLELQIPEDVAQVQVDPAAAERLATELIQHLQSGGPSALIEAMNDSLGFESETVAREASRLASHTGTVQEITLQSRERAPHGALDFTYVVRGEGGVAQVRIQVVTIAGELRQIGFLWRPPAGQRP